MFYCAMQLIKRKISPNAIEQMVKYIIKDYVNFYIHITWWNKYIRRSLTFLYGASRDFMSRKDDIKKQIENHNRRLQELKTRQAYYGISADPSIPMEIEDIETKIKELQAELEELGDVEEDYDRETFYRAATRKLLHAVFKDDEPFTFFCRDHFPAVHDEFTHGASLGLKIQLLVEYCTKHRQFNRLLDLVERDYPSQYEKFFRGRKILQLWEGLDPESLRRSVLGVYKDDYRAEFENAYCDRFNNPEKAIERSQKALTALEKSPAPALGDSNAWAYARGKFHLLIAAIQPDQEKAEQHYLESREAFHSKQWSHLQSLACLGLAITQRKLGKNKEASEVCDSAQYLVDHQSIPVNTTDLRQAIEDLRQAIKKEKLKIQEQLQLEETTPSSDKQQVKLPLFDIVAGKDIIAKESTTDLNLLCRHDYRRPKSREILSLVDFPNAKFADYILEIGDVDETDDTLHKGDWILIDEENVLENLHGQKVAVLIITRTKSGTKTCASIKTFFIAKTRSRTNRANHYFLKTESEKSPSIIVSHFSSPTRTIDKYYEEYKKGGPVEHKIVYDIRVSGIVVGDPIPATAIKAAARVVPTAKPKPPQPLLSESIPIISDIAAGLGRIADENIEDYLLLGDNYRNGADFAVKVFGDSMKGHGILSGDIALIRQQSGVEMGEIAAVVVTTLTESEGVLKIYYRYEKRADMQHWFLKSSNPSSEHLVIIPSGTNANAIQDLYAKDIQAGKIKIYENAELSIAGKYVGLVRNI